MGGINNSFAIAANVVYVNDSEVGEIMRKNTICIVRYAGIGYGAPCVKLRNIKFCIIFWLFLFKLHAISYIVAIYLYCCNMC